MKNLKSNPLQITVYGNLIGKMWMSGYGIKQFKINVNSQRERMSDNSLTILESIERYLSFDTGDFQSVSLTECHVTMTYGYTDGSKYIKVSRSIDLKYYAPLSDSWANEKEENMYYDIEFANEDE